MRGKRCKSWVFYAVLLAALVGGNPGRSESLTGQSLSPSSGRRLGQVYQTGLSAAEADELLPSKRYLMAYESMLTADRLQEREMNEDAVVLYDEALKLFRQLAFEYPMWQTNLVAFRTNYCLEGLNKARGSKKSGHDRQNVINQAASLLRPAEPDQKAGDAKEDEKKIKEAAGLEQAGDFKDALELYKAVLVENKQQSAALSGAGRCFMRLGLVAEARDLLFQWCVIPSPDNGINSLLALILCHDRQFDRAIQLAEIVLNDDNSNAAAHVVLGVALAGTGQTDAAMSEMQKALALNPRLSEAHYNLACLMLKKKPKKNSTAAAYYQNALKFGAAPDPALAKLLQK
ncbi:MAG: tetratricopeptide repeat protein [Kiritimatiellia bacterium]|nr:tetratricopeptide repeat protein [Kiritimatiellia bacterium]